MKTIKTFLLFAVTISFMSLDLPLGWFKAGSAVDSYEMGIDKSGGQDGKSAATIKSIVTDIKGFGSLMQTCLPDKFLVRRVRMTGYMKSKDVTDWAGFWLEVSETGSDKALSFDNMYDRPVKGTTDWKQYEIVVDVPAKATSLSYGALLSGTGQIWFDSLSFEIVDNSVATTGNGNAYNLPQREPTNLNFDK
jgi:hypothetical protein